MLTDAYGETLRLAELVEELLLLAHADASVDKVLVPDPKEETRASVLFSVISTAVSFTSCPRSATLET
jgi:hypothetical protein